MDSSMKKSKHEGTIQEFPYNGDDFRITDAMKQIFQRDGLFVVKSMFSKAEVDRILKALEGGQIFDKAFEVADGNGSAARMVLWNHPGTDITGMVARCEKMVNTCEQLLGDEVYHYHTKLMMKDAKFGGKHLWHQDYGYWYNNGFLTPDMLTVFVPLDRCTKENGCLQVLPGTNKCGRIEHDLEAGQTAANQERIDMLLKRFPLVYAEVEPGDAIFFHCNVLHRSDRNESDFRRYALLVAYSTKTNDPVIDHCCPSYTPLSKVWNDAVLKCNNFTNFEGKDFLDPNLDKNITSTAKGKFVH